MQSFTIDLPAGQQATIVTDVYCTSQYSVIGDPDNAATAPTSITANTTTTLGANSKRVRYLVEYNGSMPTFTLAFAGLPSTDAALITTDVTTNNDSSSKHGFMKKLSGVATQYMGGDGNWTTPASGSLVKLLTVTAATKTSITFPSVITSTYDNYLFLVTNLTGSTEPLAMEVSYDNGVTWKTSAGGYNQSIGITISSGTTPTAFGAANNDEFDLTAQTASAATSSPISGKVMLSTPSAATSLVEWKMTQMAAGGYVRNLNGAGVFNDSTTPPINAVRFYYGTDGGDGGVFAGGSITVYGYVK